MKRSEILAVYAEGPDAVVKLAESLVGAVSDLENQVRTLLDETARQSRRASLLEEENPRLKRRIALLEAENKELRDRVRELERRLNMNSRNSHKPPSSEGLSKPPAKKRKTGRPPGGKPGHKGDTLRMVEDPDEIVDHSPERCSSCNRSLRRVGVDEVDRRQVFDIPTVTVHVTEHRFGVKTCPGCGCVNRPEIPKGLEPKTQYGPNLKAIVAYLVVYQLIPLKRACELLSDLFGHTVCEATLLSVNSALSGILEPIEEMIIRALICSRVLNFDETGVRIDGKNRWLHVASNKWLTFYYPHERRGRSAMNEIGILPVFEGIACHDAFSSYLKYTCRHVLCNAHLLRDLTALEEGGEQWATDMIDLLLDAYAIVNRAKDRGAAKLSRRSLQGIEKSYERILSDGLLKNPLPDASNEPKKRGRKKKSAARNLLERLRDQREKVLMFAYDFSAPFDNNQAENDLRMTKVRQKISGGFRTWEGAYTFFRIRGYISTARKNSYPVIGALRDAFEGNPFMPPIAELN